MLFVLNKWDYYRVCVFLCLFVLTNAWGRGDWEKYGPLQVALRSGFIKCNHDTSLDLDISAIDVYFYDFANNAVLSHSIDQAAQQILSYEPLDTNKQFIIYVGGFKSDITKKTVTKIRDTFQNYPNSYLIIPDHSAYTNNEQGDRKSYARAVQYVYYIGKALGQLLATLHEGGVNSRDIRCIGHSLGGQILAHVGETFTNITGINISRLTALDPAGPCFSNSFIHNQIRSGLADYVEIYHCNAGAFGTTSVLGDVDFFANKNGNSQPNCRTPYIPGIFDSSKAAKCSHRTCIDIYAASVKNEKWYPAWSCDSFSSFSKGFCENNNKTVAGFWNPGSAFGIYYFTTVGYDLS